jgi:hypothetical protein
MIKQVFVSLAFVLWVVALAGLFWLLMWSVG